MTMLESIAKDLAALPASKLMEVAHYVSCLNPKRPEERLAAIRATAGCMGGEAGAAFEQLVREEAGYYREILSQYMGHIMLKATLIIAA